MFPGKMYFGSGSSAGSGDTDETEVDADREDDESDDENDNEGSGISNAFAPIHPPPYTERPYLHHGHKAEEGTTNGNGEKNGIIIEETHVNGMENVDTIEKETAGYNNNGKSQKPIANINQWEKSNDLNSNDNNNIEDNTIDRHSDIDIDIDNDVNVDYKSAAECHGRCITSKMSLRRALMLYLVPLYITWLGGMIDGVL